MGKTASNEKIKLRATFFNNIAVGFYVTGGVVPILAILQKSPQVAAFVEAALKTRKISIAQPELLNVVVVIIVTIAFSLLMATFHLKMANAEIEKLTD